MSGAPPPVPPLLEALILAPREPLHERLGPGERILYVGRLAPVPAPRRGLDAPVHPDLASALAEIVDRRSKVRPKPETKADPAIATTSRMVDSAHKDQRARGPQLRQEQGLGRTSEG